MKDLLKEAIADAKAVRETALANAKIALEEAFAPRLQSMLSAKLAEELSEEEEEEVEAEGTYSEGEEEAPVEAPVEAPEEEEVSEGDYSEDDSMEEGDGEMEDDLDLESIIRELELDSSEIGNDDADLYEDDMSTEEPAEDEDVDINELLNSLSEEEGEEDEDVDINEIIRSLREEDEEEEEAPASEELEEAYNVIRFLKSKINEVNLLNAKLLFSGKLFRNFSLNEGQKMKVVENFDRAHNLREGKLVYSTLAEGFKMPSSKKIVKESFASKPVASTKPSRSVLSEGAELSARFQKLAGLTKK